ncbi:MAG TPA: TolC family protein, partial [Mucilaginibacter sp.]|nr:TolC family protein [Mucilaginibacter sp.]
MIDSIQKGHPEAGRRNPRSLLPVLLSLLTFTTAAAQDHLGLEECYRLARENYPAIKKLDLIAKTSDYNVDNANKKFLPQISFSGQATYQSQTINFGEALGALPNIKLPVLSKDQYKVQGEADQLIYDGGANHYQKEVTRANAELQKQQLEVNLYALKQRINDIFFSVLLMEAQIRQNELNRSNLQTQAKKTQASLTNG